MTTHLHHAGAILNMYLLGDLSIHEDATVKSRFLDAMRMLTTHIGSRIVAKFQACKECRGTFANMPLAMEANVPPHSGWTLWANMAHTWPLWPIIY